MYKKYKTRAADIQYVNGRRPQVCSNLPENVERNGSWCIQVGTMAKFGALMYSVNEATRKNPGECTIEMFKTIVKKVLTYGLEKVLELAMEIVERVLGQLLLIPKLIYLTYKFIGHVLSIKDAKDETEKTRHYGYLVGILIKALISISGLGKRIRKLK